MLKLMLFIVAFPSICFANGLGYYEKIMRSTEFKAYVPKEYGVEMMFVFDNNPIVLGDCTGIYSPESKCVFIGVGRIVAFDDQQKIAVIKSEFSFGGSGIAIVLYIIDVSSGKTLTSDPIYLGDRVVFENATIEKNTIVTNYIGHGPRDPSCCPTTKMKRKFLYDNGDIREY